MTYVMAMLKAVQINLAWLMRIAEFVYRVNHLNATRGFIDLCNRLPVNARFVTNVTQRSGKRWPRIRRQVVAALHIELLFGAIIAIAAWSPAAVAKSPAVALPELPRVAVDTRYIPPVGRTLVVRRGGDLQGALNAADPGDVIMLEAGAIFTGPFTLPVKTGSEWIIVRSDVEDDELPKPGERIDPSYSPVMPKLTAKNVPVLTAAPGAHHYRFIGIEIVADKTLTPTARAVARAARNLVIGRNPVTPLRYSNQALVKLGDSETHAAQLPHHLIFDRCYLHGGEAGARRGVAMNSSHTAVIDSYLAGFRTVGEDSQAIAGWNGSGPFKIVNNYLEGAGENILFGGGDPSIKDLVPADIEIRGNHFSKPLPWRIGDPHYAGTPWTVKNLFELKNARRVLIDGNLFEYSWHHAQDGYAVLLTVRNQDGGAPWSVVEDVTFSNNVVRHTGGGINILGYDDNHPSRQTRRIHITNNLFYDVGGAWGRGQLFQLLDGTADVVIEHNTALQTDNIAQAGDHRAHTGFVFTGNIVLHNDYGMIGGGTGIGLPTLKRYFPDAIVRRNVIVGGPVNLYPGGNFFPQSIGEVGFVDPANGDYRLQGAGGYEKVATGAGAGVDFKALCDTLFKWPRTASALFSGDGVANVCAASNGKSRGEIVVFSNASQE